MIPGTWSNATEVALHSQFTTVPGFTPISFARRLWESPRSSRRFLRWSPKVLSFRG